MIDDACVGGLSNYEKKKQALISANIWKSNFISLWKKFGSFQTINGVECFDLYRISDVGEGQERMSKHLRQPDLWEKTQDDDIDKVSLYFNLLKLIEIEEDGVEQWRTARKEELDETLFDTLKYEIVDKEVSSHGFYKAGELVTGEFYDKLSGWVAEKKRAVLDENYDWDGTFSYSEEVGLVEVQDMIDDASSYTADAFEGKIVFDVDEVGDDVRSFLSEQGLGTDIIDQLVIDHGFEVLDDEDKYYLPLESAKKMNGFIFIELVTKTLDFRIKKKGGFWRFLKRIVKLLLAAIATYFQQYWLAASLLVGFVADETGSTFLRVVSQVLGLFQGDFTSFSSLGVSEALNLLLNIYSIYLTLEYAPEDGKEIKEDTDVTQEMFYEAPYGAYDGIYCYEKLISVVHDKTI